MLQIVGDLAAILGKLDHDLLVQPDIHLGRVLRVAGVMQLRGEASCAAAWPLSRSSSFIRSTIEVRQWSFCLFCLARPSRTAATSTGADHSTLGPSGAGPSRVTVPDGAGDAVGLAGARWPQALDGAEAARVSADGRTAENR